MKQVHHERHRVIEPTTRTSGNLLTAHSSSRPPPQFLTICPIFWCSFPSFPLLRCHSFEYEEHPGNWCWCRSDSERLGLYSFDDQDQRVGRSSRVGLFIGLSPCPVTAGNSHHQDYHIFSRASLQTFICHCYWEGGTAQIIHILHTWGCDIVLGLGGVRKTWWSSCGFGPAGPNSGRCDSDGQWQCRLCGQEPSVWLNGDWYSAFFFFFPKLNLNSRF